MIIYDGWYTFDGCLTFLKVEASKKLYSHNQPQNGGAMVKLHEVHMKYSNYIQDSLRQHGRPENHP